MKKFSILVLLCLAFLVFVFFLLRDYANSFYLRVMESEKMYAYETFTGVVNPILYVKNYQLKDSIVNYYRAQESGIKNPKFNFPPLSLPYNRFVYVLNYSPDSVLAEVLCYENGKKEMYRRGWVYSKLLHKYPPPDSLIKRKL